jgi:hypothetical protein
MDRIANKIGVVQNMGLIDRTLRFVIGGILLGTTAGYLQATGSTMLDWHAYIGLLSIYPFITAILGWDPFYHLFNAKSCSLNVEDRNQCGTFPYEVEAALGKKPKPEKGFDHSVFGSHH